MPDVEAMKATVDAYIERMSAGDKDGWVDLFADDAYMEDPVGTPRHEGREAIGAFWDMVQAMSDRMWIERTGPIRVAGHEAAFPMQAHSETGDAKLVVDIIDVFAFDDAARITGMRAFWDMNEMRPE